MFKFSLVYLNFNFYFIEFIETVYELFDNPSYDSYVLL